MGLAKTPILIAVLIAAGTLPGHAGNLLALGVSNGKDSRLSLHGDGLGSAPLRAPITDPINDPAERAWNVLAPAPPPLDDKTILIYSTWAKYCGKTPDRDAKQLCFTMNDGHTEDGFTVIMAGLLEPEGESRKTLRIAVSSPLQLQYGARVMIDRRPVISGAFFTCLGTSCVADYEATPEVVGMLKSGKTLLIQAISLSAKAINFSMPLADNSRNSFGKVNEGAAVDAGEPELQRERLRDYIQFAHRSPSKAPFGQRDRGSRENNCSDSRQKSAAWCREWPSDRFSYVRGYPRSTVSRKD